jgi:hypothetical protein
MRLDWLGALGQGRVISWENLREHFIARYPEQGWIVLLLAFAVVVWCVAGFIGRLYAWHRQRYCNFPLDSLRRQMKTGGQLVAEEIIRITRSRKLILDRE